MFIFFWFFYFNIIFFVSLLWFTNHAYWLEIFICLFTLFFNLFATHHIISFTIYLVIDIKWWKWQWKVNIILVEITLDKFNTMVIQLQHSYFLRKIHSNALLLKYVVLGGNGKSWKKLFFMISFSLPWE